MLIAFGLYSTINFITICILAINQLLKKVYKK